MWPFSQWPVEVSSSHIHAIHPIHMSHLSEPFPALSVLEICCRKKHINLTQLEPHQESSKAMPGIPGAARARSLPAGETQWLP